MPRRANGDGEYCEHISLRVAQRNRSGVETVFTATGDLDHPLDGWPVFRAAEITTL